MFTLGSFEPRRLVHRERSFGGAVAGLAQRYGLIPP